ncbi:MAG TPA: MSMEG_0567/Sll0786 family nitrogen starvation N-acetyltransferase [Stellaceae bacterium]|jgi:putative N-acetyltransferase (TIGR04045 family)|nr:MSMEG_0567/Sll0786 family nitrogen starvation N-acetyltransferase [Stellaceae bacterium]
MFLDLHDRPPVFMPSEFRIRLAGEAWERAGYARLRREVFCLEQAIFQSDDRDAVDEIAVPIVAIAVVMGMPDRVVGTVRIHQAAAGLWYGSRLTVQRDFRRQAGLGAALITLAVGTAQARGCERFLAHVQAQNVPLFERLHWRALAPVALHGRPHRLMEADLAHYPPCRSGELAPLRLSPVAAA